MCVLAVSELEEHEEDVTAAQASSSKMSLIMKKLVVVIPDVQVIKCNCNIFTMLELVCSKETYFSLE